MKNTWKIARWEIMRNLTNKQFLIGLLITPVIFVVFAGLPTLLERWNQPETVTYYVQDEIGVLPTLKADLSDNIRLIEHSDPSSIQAAVLSEDAAGYFRLTPSFLETGRVELMFNERNNDAVRTIESALSRFLQQARLQMVDMDPERLAYLMESAEIVSTAIDDADVPGTEQIIVSIAVVALIYFLIFTSGTMLMQSALQEKRDRMAEVVLSSISPSELMQGKILGQFLLGVIQLAFWMIVGLPAVIYFLDFPIWEIITKANLLMPAFFGLFGYLLFSSLFVGMGATMEDLQSAGNSQALVIMLPMLSFLFLAPVISNPDGAVAQFASLFPFTSPLIMIIRDSFTRVPLWQVLTSGAILVATSVLITMMAAKIFRIGMLMYGKTATIGEIVKWLRYKDI